MEGLDAGRSSKALPTPVPRDDTALGGPPLPQHMVPPLCGVGRVVVVEVLVVIIIVVVVVVEAEVGVEVQLVVMILVVLVLGSNNIGSGRTTSSIIYFY